MAIIRSVLISFYAIIFCLGVPSNIIILAAYSRKKKKIGTDIFIMGLAVTDFIGSAISVLKLKAWVASNAYCKLQFFLNVCITSAQVTMTLVISVDRYIAVCFPVRRRPSVRQAIIIVIFSYVMLCLLVAPILWVVHYDDFIEDCMYRSGIKWFTFYDTYFAQWYVITCASVPSLLYCRVIYALRRQSKVRARLITNPAITKASRLDENKEPKKTTSSRGCNEDGQPVGRKPLNQDEFDQTLHQRDKAFISTALGSMSLMTKDGSQTAAKGSSPPSKHRSPQAGILETISGKHELTMSPGPADTPDTSPAVDVASTSQIKARDDQNDNKSGRLSENRLTLMLGIITIIYFLSMIPMIVGRYIPIETRRAFMKRSDIHHTIYAICFRFYEVNTFINLFVYWQLNRRFREDCKEVFNQVKRIIFNK